jgi:16S rRNA (adenine1518-N6/adenine1519-N6)-dimethyltransferase
MSQHTTNERTAVEPGRQRKTTPVRIDAAVVKRTLKEANLRARRALSQNFLVDAAILDEILAAADPQPGRRVLEIGPGLGILTGGLIAAGAAVTAVELDAGMAAHVRSTFGEAIALGDAVASGGAPSDTPGSLRLLRGDILDQELNELIEAPFDVVANLPYHITSPVLHLLLGDLPRPERAVLMVQLEVAQRITAKPGEMSYLSVFVQYHAKARIAFKVPRDAFEPAPAVDSAVIVVEPWTADDPARPILPPDAEEHLWRLVQAGFRERRKMVRNVLSRQLPIDGTRVDAALAAAGITPDRRPQTLSVGEWIRLLEELGPMPEDRRGRQREDRHAMEDEGAAE